MQFTNSAHRIKKSILNHLSRSPCIYSRLRKLTTPNRSHRYHDADLLIVQVETPNEVTTGMLWQLQDRD